MPGCREKGGREGGREAGQRHGCQGGVSHGAALAQVEVRQGVAGGSDGDQPGAGHRQFYGRAKAPKANFWLKMGQNF